MFTCWCPYAAFFHGLAATNPSISCYGRFLWEVTATSTRINPALSPFPTLWLQLFVNIRGPNNNILNRNNYSKYEQVVMKTTQLLCEMCYAGTAAALERIFSRGYLSEDKYWVGQRGVFSFSLSSVSFLFYSSFSTKVTIRVDVCHHLQTMFINLRACELVSTSTGQQKNFPK